jgi:Na+/H+ antiporter NhaD/arsenite permease-like protein
MTFFIIAVFVIGYLAIMAEHPLRLNKAASALLTGTICWTLYMISSSNTEVVNESLLHHLGEISSIVFFLLGAMTIVELIDLHHGFEVITDRLGTKNKSKLLIIVSIITFFLSALLDNLTTSIVMTSLCARLLQSKNDRLFFVGMIIISANAGGAWSPLGDVTTTMLWIGGQITALNIIKMLILPSLAVALVPTLLLSSRFRGQLIESPPKVERSGNHKEGKYILLLGVLLLLFVPVFKSVTHLPPFVGMLIALGVMWVFTTIIHFKNTNPEIEKLSVAHALERIDTSSILFFLGILLAVSALQSIGVLTTLADALSSSLGNDYLIGITLGLLSAIVDNVPLVAAAQGMYSLEVYPTDHIFWEFLALTTGTGGSAIIIGSAAGVAVMGIEKVEFMWYMKHIAWLALVGFAAGVLVFILQQTFL